MEDQVGSSEAVLSSGLASSSSANVRPSLASFPARTPLISLLHYAFYVLPISNTSLAMILGRHALHKFSPWSPLTSPSPFLLVFLAQAENTITPVAGEYVDYTSTFPQPKESGRVFTGTYQMTIESMSFCKAAPSCLLGNLLTLFA